MPVEAERWQLNPSYFTDILVLDKGSTIVRDATDVTPEREEDYLILIHAPRERRDSSARLFIGVHHDFNPRAS